MGRTKFNVNKDTTKRTYDNIIFDSCAEMRFYKDVVLPKVETGEILSYELQKPYILQPKFKREDKTIQPIKYVADFYLEYSDGRQEVIDIKGFADSVAKLKRKMFWYTFPELDYKWIVESKIDGGFCSYEYVNAQRKIRKAKKAEKKNKEIN